MSVTNSCACKDGYCCHVVNYSYVFHWGKFIEIWSYSNRDPDEPPLSIDIKKIEETHDKIIKEVIFRGGQQNQFLVANYLQNGRTVTTSFCSELKFKLEFWKEGEMLLRVVDCVVAKAEMK